MSRSDREPDDQQFSDYLAAYDEALEAGGATGDVIDAAIESDEALGARLAGAADCLELLEHVRRLGSLSGSGALADALETLITSAQGEPPAHLGRFQIQRELGRGGYGIVFLATDPVLGRKVAIKVPRPDTLVTPDLRRRFLREAQAAAGLDHPHIVRVLEASDLGPVCYIATSYCGGPTLRAWLDACPSATPPELAARIVSMLADAVAHAHDRGILHRDIKPANILLESRENEAAKADDGAPPFVPRLTDFGLAKVLQTSDDQTRSGIILGTPQYMAPEQAEGRTDDICRATDVHALGVLLYELLTRRTPYRGATALDTLRRVVSESPTPLRSVDRALPRDLEAICLKCIEKEPVRRYPDAAGLHDDLQRFLTGRSTQARPLRRWRRATRWVRRHPATSGSVVFLLLAVASIPWVRGLHLQSLSARDDAAQWRTELQTQAELAESRDARVAQFRYAADMRLAYQAWRSADLAQALELLGRHRVSAPGQNTPGFAWRLLWNCCHRELAALSGHEGDVYAVAYSPDGKLLASAGRDGTARVWNVSQGKQVFVLVGHTNEVNEVEFAPDGQTLATCSDDGTVRVWDGHSGAPSVHLSGHVGGSRCLAYSPDGSLLASGGEDSLVRLWDTTTGQEVAALQGHRGGISTVTFSRDGQMLASGDSKSRVKVWRVSTFSEVLTIDDLAGNVSDVEFAPDCQTIATADEDRCVNLWEVATGSLRSTYSGHVNVVQSLSFSPEGQQLVTASKDRTVRVWDVASGNTLNVFAGHAGRAWSAVFSRDGERVATGGADGTVKLWDTSERTPSRVRLPPGTRVAERCMTILPDGTTMVLGSPSGNLVFGDPHDRSSWLIKDDLITTMRVLTSSACRALVAMTDDRGGHRALLWNPQTGEHDVALRGEPLSYSALALNPQGNLLAAATGSEIVLYDIRTRRVSCRFEAHQSGIECLAYSPDSRYLASGSQDQSVKLWDAASGEEVFTLPGHRSQARCVAFSRRGQYLAAAGHDRTIRIWDVVTGRAHATLRGHDAAVNALAYAPDNTTLVTADDSGHLKLWDVATGQELLDLAEHAGAVTAVVFSPEGDYLATLGEAADGSGEVLLWQAPPEIDSSAGH